VTAELPPAAAWRLLEAHEGFETVLFRQEADVVQFEGYSAGVEEGVAWGFRYELEVDSAWATRSVRISSSGGRELQLDGDGVGSWLVDGHPAPHLEGVLDVDLEGSACTNCLPIRRLAPAVGERIEAPTAYVRAGELRVERLAQRYRRLDSGRYDYESPDHGFRAVLAYDEHGLILDYPGIAVRVA
jgi:uncharacterized protein